MKAGWKEQSFEDCIEQVTYTQKIQRKDFLDSGAYPVVSQEADFINGYWNDAADLFEVSRPVIVFGDHTQVVKYVDFDFVLGADGVKVLRSCDFILPKYFYYYLLAFPLKDLGYARHYRLLRELKITYPPLPEQTRIVRILDEAFEGIATAKANTERNRQNARALFESHLQSVFTQRGEGWVETRLGETIDLLAGFAFKSNQYANSVDAVRLLRGDNIIQGSLRWDDAKMWPASDAGEYITYQLRAGDVVLAMDRPWVRAGLKCAQISDADLPCLLVQRTARLRGRNNLENRFLAHLISSYAFTNHILGVQTGIGVPHISGKQIKDFQFWKPSVDEQMKVVAKLDSLRTETQRLKSVYQRKLDALEALKKSLLHQAFNGEL